MGGYRKVTGRDIQCQGISLNLVVKYKDVEMGEQVAAVPIKSLSAGINGYAALFRLGLLFASCQRSP